MMNLKEIPKKYRPIPFWSWNEKLTVDETKRQIAEMEKVGLGGYFMHARGGLQTEYMGDEWFENITAGAEEGKKRGMGAWAYDENGWPSGFGNGIVNGKGIQFQQKYLRIEEGEKNTDRTITNVDGYHLYYDVNPFYVDVLDKDVVKVFIEEIYQPYYDKFGTDIPGFFTDEPQISRNGIPWSFKLEHIYKNEYDEELLPKLPQLFKPIGDYKKTRFKFWKLVSKTFSESFCKQIYEWCDQHGMKLTGHMVLEEGLLDQLTSNGSVMPNYEYFHIPGMDWLGRNINPPTTPLQVSSVAHQLGKKQVLSETFALTGWNVSFEELKWIFEWQMVRGITLLCPHLQGYSLRGIRKRDYPASFFYHQPWWNEYKVFVDSVSRIGMLLSEGEIKYSTLLIHPQSSAWLCYDDGDNEGIIELNNSFLNDINTLEQKHILFHLGDETIMERHARVEGNKLIIGTQEYTTVVMPKHLVLYDNTKKLLDEFKANGGIIITSEEIEPNNIIDNPNVTYTERVFDDFNMYYFVNSTDKSQSFNIKKGSCILNIKTGETEEFNSNVTLEPLGSIVVLDGIKAEKQNAKNCDLKKVSLTGEWDIKKCDYNALTLDYCDYWFDGELVEEHGHISSLQTKAYDLGRAVNIDMKFNVTVKDIPDDAYLVCETPEIFSITVNGKELNKKDCGYYFDTSFRKLNLSGYLKQGVNEIFVNCYFEQSDLVYENIKKSKIFESEKNKLTYDMEVESFYIVGNFSVKTNGKFVSLDRHAVRYVGDFSIAKPQKTVALNNIEQQGFPFFAGNLTVTKKFNLLDKNYCFSLDERNTTVVKVSVNGKDVESVMWRPYYLDLSECLIKGENTIEITLVNSLRNLLGPHHQEIGECYAVTPGSFFKEESLWGSWGANAWNTDYCFVEFGVN